MGTGYTVNDDSTYTIRDNRWAAQTFIPEKDFNLWYAKFKTRAHPSDMFVRIDIQETTDGKPNGTIIQSTTAKTKYMPLYPPGDFNRVMFTEGALVHAGVQYALIMRPWDKLYDNYVFWRYDAGDALYPVGNRLYSQDEGVSWVSCPNDDHMFFVWGTPPAPPPPPVPPEPNWVPLDIEQTTIEGGFTIVLTSDTPSHLWLYWTDKPPWTHRQSAIKRGLPTTWDSYWCYVSWHLIEQEEAGDTLIHTFTWTGWETCQTKYFRFHGTINGLNSLSDSPIFQKHYIAPPADYYFDYPPAEPKIYDYNNSWVASSFDCLKTGTPEKLGIWLWNYGARFHDMKLFIEESVDQPPIAPGPYTDITGRILCEGSIPAADINAHIGVFWYHEVTLYYSSMLTLGRHYIFTSCDLDPLLNYRYRVRNTLVANNDPTFHADNLPNYPIRNWTRWHNLKVKSGRLL